MDNSAESTPTFVIVGFQARKRIDSQTQNHSTFDTLSVSNAVCKIGSEENPNDGIECDYDLHKHDQAYYEIENFYTLHSESNLLNPFLSLHKFRKKNNFYVFDLSNQKPPIASQLVRLEFEFSARFTVADNVVFASMLSPKLKCIISDEQRHFDLTYLISYLYIK